METTAPMFGHSGLVIKAGDSVFKGPYHDTIQEIEHEASVYEMLGHHPRIAEYRGRSWHRIKLSFYNNETMSHKISDRNFRIPSMLWVNQILEALIFLHGKRIVHCDIRGPNIFVTDELDVVLADFGSAAIEGKKETDSCYDFRHCPPDFLDYERAISPKDDLFAFGTVLYHLFARKRPFEGYEESEITQSYLDGAFPDVSDLEVGHVIRRCWHKTYQSAIEVQNDLGKLRSTDLKIDPNLRWLPPIAFGCAIIFGSLLARYTTCSH